ncbi:MAG: FecR domain-containing protein, partial [Spirochaetes bacterium]|nr:FecR domain-containing protein [Spirochaetota bacterium]
MKKIVIYIFSILFILSFGLLYAQEDMEEEPAYVSYLAGNVDVDLTPDNNMEDFEMAELDMEIPAGTLIRTGMDGLCEITMPDQSTIKVSGGSVFQVDEMLISRETGKSSQKFKLLFGKIRARVEKFTTSDSKFEIASGTALAGIRGTVIGDTFDGVNTKVLCFEGEVTLESLTGAFEPVVMNAGQMSSVAEGGIPEPVIDIPPEEMQEWAEDLEKFAEEAAEKVEEVKEAAKDEEIAKKAAEKGESFFTKFLKLNAYVGSITIDGNVYNRWIFTPELSIGKLGVGLYIPAIFAPDEGILGKWENNDEWDYTDVGDGFHDTLIKFYYISWGEWGDPLYFKIGGIDSFYLGHGFIVDNYSNMIYFPEEIIVGMQFNVNLHLGGFETMLADFSRRQLFGGRFFVRPMGQKVPLAIGVSTVYERPKPASWPDPDGSGPLYQPTDNENQLPRILIFGADIEMPILSIDRFTMMLYADGAMLGYIYPEVPDPLVGKVEPGALELIKGIGTGIGLMGQIAKIFNYRVEYRFIRNYYEPGMIDLLWENRRLEYQQELMNLIIAQDLSNFEDTNSAGFLIEGSAILFEKVEFGLGYENYNKMVVTKTGATITGTTTERTH